MEKEKETITESVALNEKLYSQDEIQDMLTACKKDSKLKKKVLANIISKGPLGAQDKAAIGAVIDSGSVDDFYRYDSAVCDKFITAYEKVMGIKESADVNTLVNMILDGVPLTQVINPIVND